MIGLDPLLAALRGAGLPVGVTEMARLQRVFALSLELEPGDYRLQSVLRAVLVKSAEDRAMFEQVFDTWVRQADHEVRLREEVPQAQPEPVRAPRPRRRRIRWTVLALVALVLLSLALGGHVKVSPREEIEKVAPHPGPGDKEGDTPEPPPDQPRTFTVLVPVLTVTPGPWQGWIPLGLAWAALAVAGDLWFALRRRRWMPEPAPEPSRKGPPRVFLSSPEPAGLQLLLPREEEALVWGIGHFVSEEPTRRLDLAATVRATARAAGLPHLRFHLARHPREVWLWIDEAADDPEIPRLAEEVSAALAAHGLPVERAFFRGIPDLLVHADRQVFAPNEVDERRDAALVAILTDGRILARHYAVDDRRMGLGALLRSLSHWPRLAFVDFSSDPGPLGAILSPHFIERILPSELAGFLGAGEALRQRAMVETDAVAIWAAACALAPSPVDEDQAFELRRRLGLTDSPWAIRALRAEAPGPAGRLQWQAPLRARRINWLRAAESQTEDGLDPNSLLGQALDFWETRYDRELEERLAGEPGKLWQDTPAHQHLRMERSLLALWNGEGVSEAIEELYSLHGGTLRETIEEHLGQLAPLDRGGPDDLHLPWRWERRSGPEQDMLLKMHLGGGMPPVTLRRPGRLWLGLAVCLGLAAGALSGAALRGPVGPPVLLHGPGKPADAKEETRQLPTGAWEVTVATPRISMVREVLPAAQVAVRWESCENGETLTDQGMVFVRICPGTFMMGSPDSDLRANPDERPAHQVTLSDEYWIGRYEVTEEQYGRIRAKPLPMEVDWNAADRFCKQHGWRLPTEAEWEYAARAGTKTAWSFGDGEKALGDYAWFGEDFSFGRLHQGGNRKPNPWGLYDMHGNVWEWVADWYEERYKPGLQTDPKGPPNGRAHVLRGGGFFNDSKYVRSAIRLRFQTGSPVRGIGFRCARSPGRQP
jgi:formylglycine-generating enzyme required for sulfatase activity